METIRLQVNLDRSKSDLRERFIKKYRDQRDKTYRIDLDKDELETAYKLFAFLESVVENTREAIMGGEENLADLERLKEKIINPKEIERSVKKSMAAEDATQFRQKKAKEKIQNAINYLKMSDKKITAYSIAKEGGVSYNTARKYIKDIEL